MKKVTENIGIVNAFIRLSCGFSMLAWGTSKLIKRPFSTMPLVIIMMAAMKIAEGITRFCPLTYLFEEKMEHMTEESSAPKKQYDDLVNPS